MTGRLFPKRLRKALDQGRRISSEDFARVRAVAGLVRPPRSFLFKTPDDFEMVGWRDLTIASDDGTPLEAWYIPAKGGDSDKLVVFNHPLSMCRAGLPGHYGMPWAPLESAEVDFVAQYRILTDAGYNVLTYDLRNHGNSGAANDGLCGGGQWEWRDCVGVKRFVDADPALSKMKVALYCQGLGGCAQYHAFHRRPDLFADVRCMVSPLVEPMGLILGGFAERLGVDEYGELVDLELMKAGAFVAAEMTPRLWAPSVTLPVYMLQIRHDARPRDAAAARTTFDALCSERKRLFWLEQTTHRFRDGFNEFGRRPEPILDFLAEHMS